MYALVVLSKSAAP